MPPVHNGLLDRAVEGDRDAVARLLEQHGPQVRRVLAGRIPIRWQGVLSIDDVMQETYIDAFLDIRRFDPRDDASFTAWLTTLARRNLLDALRMLDAEKRGRNYRQVHASPEESLAMLYERIGGASSTPSHAASRAEAYQSLQYAVAQLPEAYRTVIEMYDLQGQSIDAVAARLHRSPGAVFMLRARAHRHVGQLMGAASQYLSGTA